MQELQWYSLELHIFSVIFSLQGILTLTYVVFILALLFDVQTTVQGFNNQTVDLKSASCESQGIVVGTTEGDYGMYVLNLICQLQH